MRNLMERIRETGNKLADMRCKLRNTKDRLYLLAMTAYTTVICSGYAYATGVQTEINTLVEKGTDFIFNFAGGAIILSGAFNLITAIYKFISASQARDAGEQREAGSAIAIAIMILVLGAAVFVLKTPIYALIKKLIAG